MEMIETYLQRICQSLESLNARLEALEHQEDDRETLKAIKGRLLTQQEAAEMLGLCSASVKKMREAGKIRAVPVGKLWKYRLDDVLRVKTNLM